MKTYQVYKHSVQGIKAVKDGFSWPAFLIFPIWFIHKKLGQELLRIIAFIGGCWGAIITFAATYNFIAGNDPLHYAPALCGLFLCIMGIIYCFKANEIYASRLQELGYELIATVEAQTTSYAIALANQNA